MEKLKIADDATIMHRLNVKEASVLFEYVLGPPPGIDLTVTYFTFPTDEILWKTTEKCISIHVMKFNDDPSAPDCVQLDLYEAKNTKGETKFAVVESFKIDKNPLRLRLIALEDTMIKAQRVFDREEIALCARRT